MPFLFLSLMIHRHPCMCSAIDVTLTTGLLLTVFSLLSNSLPCTFNSSPPLHVRHDPAAFYKTARIHAFGAVHRPTQSMAELRKWCQQFACKPCIKIHVWRVAVKRHAGTNGIQLGQPAKPPWSSSLPPESFPHVHTWAARCHARLFALALAGDDVTMVGVDP